MVIARRLAVWNRRNFTRETACRSEMMTFSSIYFFWQMEWSSIMTSLLGVPLSILPRIVDTR